MKYWRELSIALFATLALSLAFGQSYGTFIFGPIAPVVSNCTLSSAGQTALCAVGAPTTGYQLYVSFNGGAYGPLAAASGVLTFNGRSGSVTLQKADVTALGLSYNTTVTVAAPSATATTTAQ